MTRKTRRQKLRADKRARRRRRAAEAIERTEVARIAAGELDRRFGPGWRDDTLLVAKFARVFSEEFDASRHSGIVVPRMVSPNEAMPLSGDG